MQHPLFSGTLLTLLLTPLLLFLTPITSSPLPPTATPESAAAIRSAAGHGVCALALCIIQCCVHATDVLYQHRREQRLLARAATAAALMNRQAQEGPLRAGTRVVLEVERGVGRRIRTRRGLSRRVRTMRVRERYEIVAPEGPRGGRVAVGGRCSGGDCGGRTH